MKGFQIFSLLILNLIFVFGQVVPPQLPTAFNATVQFTMTAFGMPFSLTGPFYYDMSQNAMRIDGEFFGEDFIDLYRFDIGEEYQIADGACNPQDLAGPMYPMDVPPFATYVGINNVDGNNCETFKVNFMGMLQMVYYVTNTTNSNGTVIPVLQRVTVVIGSGAQQISQQYDFSNVVSGEQDPSLFDPTNYGCPNPTPPPVYNVNGYVVDSVTGKVVPGAAVTIDYTTVTSDANGLYQFTGITWGYYSINATATGYFIGSININITTDINAGTSSTIFLSPKLPVGGWRAVLSWGAQPQDLDAHILTPWGCNVGFSNKVCKSGTDVASLDRDAIYGWGPETITLTNFNAYGSGNFSYVVFIYSYGSYPNSNAVVNLYNENGLYETFNVPTTGYNPARRYWSVFNLQFDGTVFPINQVGII